MAAEGIDIIIKNTKGNTPLHVAAENGDLEAVQALVATERIDSNAENEEGHTPLDLAASKGCLDVVRFLSLRKNPSSVGQGKKTGR